MARIPITVSGLVAFDLISRTPSPVRMCIPLWLHIAILHPIYLTFTGLCSVCFTVCLIASRRQMKKPENVPLSPPQGYEVFIEPSA